MGISSKAHDLIDLEKASLANIPIIRRYSGGGTVVIEENTILTSFILQKEDFPYNPFPEPLLSWSAEFFSKAFGLDLFQLKEQDYALGNHKCAGNAQYITKERLVHHTSFLWDYSKELMNLLLSPKKAPTYREKRSHEDFLCILRPYFSSKQELFEKLMIELTKSWKVEKISLEDLSFLNKKQVRIATSYEKSPSVGS